MVQSNEYIDVQKGGVSFRVRVADNYVDATQLAKCLGVHIGQWRNSVRFKKYLPIVMAETRKSENDLFQPRKKHSTFVHPLLAMNLVNYSKSELKQVALNVLERQEFGDDKSVSQLDDTETDTETLDSETIVDEAEVVAVQKHVEEKVRDQVLKHW